MDLKYKIKEISLQKNEFEIRNLEKEYIKITRHEEIFDNLKQELSIKYVKDLKKKEMELENNFKSKSSKFEEEKRIENEFTIENQKKSIKKLENSHEDFKKLLNDFEDKLKKEIENNDKLTESNEYFKKKIQILSLSLEEEQREKKNQSEKINTFELKINNITNSNYNYQEIINNLVDKLNYLEGEKNVINKTLASKEDDHVKNLECLERKYFENNLSHIQKYEEECKDHENTKSMLSKIEKSYIEIQDLLANSKNKITQLNQEIAVLEEITNNLNFKNKNLESDYDKIEKKLFESHLKQKRTILGCKNLNDLFIKSFKTKLNSIRNEINQIKHFSLNEINSIKKEYSRKIEETLLPKFKLLHLGNEKQAENRLLLQKDSLTKEFQCKFDEQNSEY